LLDDGRGSTFLRVKSVGWFNGHTVAHDIKHRAIDHFPKGLLGLPFLQEAISGFSSIRLQAMEDSGASDRMRRIGLLLRMPLGLAACMMDEYYVKGLIWTLVGPSKVQAAAFSLATRRPYYITSFCSSGRIPGFLRALIVE